MYEAAILKLLEGKLAEADLAAEQLLNLEPENVTFLAFKCAIEVKKADLAAAAGFCGRAEAIDPANYALMMSHSRLFVAQGKSEQALALLEHAQSLHPTYVDEILIERADIELDLGNTNEAASLLIDAAKSDTATPSSRSLAFRALGQMAYQLQNYELAARSFRMALQESGLLAVSNFLFLCWSHIQKAEFSDARTACEYAVEQNEQTRELSDDDVMDAYAVALLGAGETQLAYQTLKPVYDRTFFWKTDVHMALVCELSGSDACGDLLEEAIADQGEPEVLAYKNHLLHLLMP